MKTGFSFILPLVLCGGALQAGLPQSIPAADVAVKAPGAPPFSLPALTDAGLPVLWEVLAGPVTVSGSTVSLTGATGSVTLRGRQPGNASVDPAADRYVTFMIDHGGGFVKIVSGETHVTAIRADGTLWAWGDNTYGQLGDGTQTAHVLPEPVVTAEPGVWTHLASGRAHTVARRSDGTLWAWGANEEGQLGTGNTVNRLFPTRIGTLASWAGVACGSDHTLAWRTDGTLWAWGDNSQGQLGDGTIADRNAPVRVGTASDWVEIAAGAFHTVGRRAGGSLWGWGFNASGQVGDGTTTRRLSPVRIGTASDWAGVGAGFLFSAARRTDGSLWTWGNNGAGQLGHGNRISSQEPVRVGSDTDWASLHCGAACMIATKTTGWLYAWGDNSAGQLGDGTTSSRTTPVQTLAGPWTSVTVGAACGLGIRNDVIWSWGTNDYGQLGIPAGGSSIAAVPPAARLPYRSAQTIAPPAAVRVRQTLPFSGTSSSGLPVGISVLSGPAAVSGGTRLDFTGEGSVEITLEQPGDPAWEAAVPRTVTLVADGTPPVFGSAAGNLVVQAESGAGTVVTFSPQAADALAGSVPVVCLPASGSLFPPGVTTVFCSADDGVGNVALHQLTVRVNRRPAASAFSVSATGSAPVTLRGTDPDGDALTYSIATPPAHGTLSGSAPDLIYTPAPGYSGPDSFTFTASDDTGALSLPATVTLAAVADDDADSLPDSWETEKLGGTSQGAADDADADGLANRLEYLAGTDPADPASGLRVEPAGTPGSFLISPVRPGIGYQLQISDDLGAWHNAAEGTFASPGQGTVADPRPELTALPRQFYRITLRLLP